MTDKKLVVNLSCHHTLVLERSEVARTLNGNHANCPKCPVMAPPRRVLEKAWVNAKDKP